eukprot:TRINITY_DN10099_c0_g4_i2.p1 TRINITY_DN10099_c0_g4~~TRINITY_DN10099_c0_g4_i2.p1  ORF type:complete len:868 (+),score=255.18 TRINITY_DN10099_c0_g4_i2:124-2727(+)
MPKICEKGGSGLVFPLAGDAEVEWGKEVRAILYFLGLIYCFLGVNIVADYFMSSIEMITSVKRRVRDSKTGRLKVVVVWNEAVANLTLMALGSSAPEIMLSLVDSVKEGFFSSALGPGTIVGSAAFNLLVIVPVCMLAIGADEVRKIRQLDVYAITLVFSLFAYGWLYFICVVTSKDVIELWEAAATLTFMPLLVLLSYLADIGVFRKKDKEVDETPLIHTVGSHEEDAISKHDHASHSGKARKNEEKLAHALAVAQKHLHDNEDSGMQSGKRKTLHMLHQVHHAAGDDGRCIRDEEGRAYSRPNGILTFDREVWEVMVEKGAHEEHITVLRRNGTKGNVTCTWWTEKLTAVPGVDYMESRGTLDFQHGQTHADLSIEIMPKRHGEKNDEFLVYLSEPTGGAIFNPNDDGGTTSCVLSVLLINHSHEVVPAGQIGNMMLKLREDLLDADIMELGFQLWCDQIAGVCTIEDDDDDEDEGDKKDETDGDNKKEKRGPGIFDVVMWALNLPWNVIYAISMPPPVFGEGWVLFFVALLHIGAITVLVCDLASLLGCCLGIDDSVTAITIVALGTSLPDLFASMTAAREDDYADASIVNVTGSNSVNVFLGIGLPWMMCAAYWENTKNSADWDAKFGNTNFKPGQFVVIADNLGFSVSVFTSLALLAFVGMRFKRVLCGGELGGPKAANYALAGGMIFMWFTYVGLSILYQADKKVAEACQMAVIALGLAGLVVGLIFEAAVQMGIIEEVIIEPPEEPDEPEDCWEEPEDDFEEEEKLGDLESGTINPGDINLEPTNYGKSAEADGDAIQQDGDGKKGGKKKKKKKKVDGWVTSSGSGMEAGPLDPKLAQIPGAADGLRVTIARPPKFEMAD